MRSEKQQAMVQKMQMPGIDRRMLETAYRQFCMDICLPWQQYKKEPTKKIYIQKMKYEPGTCYPENTGARRVTGHDSFLKVILSMGKVFMGADERIYDWVCDTYGACDPEWFCKYENLRQIEKKLHEYGRKILDTHIYYLPAEGSLAGAEEKDRVSNGAAVFPICWYEQEEIFMLKDQNRFQSAICFSETQPDVLAVAAMNPCEDMGYACGVRKPDDEAGMVGMAGASADSDLLWQIGINVDEAYRGQGLAVGLVSLIKEEILRRGKVPYYGTSESHTISQTIAYKTGFVPAWTEVFVGKA